MLSSTEALRQQQLFPTIVGYLFVVIIFQVEQPGGSH
jgi:hypothetical protein